MTLLLHFLQVPLRYPPSTPTTVDLIVSLFPCRHQFHRLCLEPLQSESAQYIHCPMCRTPGTLTKVDLVIAQALWDAGYKPDCLCGKTHDAVSDFEKCESRPKQCDRCFDVARHCDFERGQDGKCAHDTDCQPPVGKKCANIGCAVMLHDGNEGQKAVHAMSCPFRKVKCNSCRVTMQYHQFAEHYNDACKGRGRKCIFCEKIQQLMPNCKIAPHTSQPQCPVNKLLSEAVRNPQAVKSYIALAEAEDSAAKKFTDVPDVIMFIYCLAMDLCVRFMEDVVQQQMENIHAYHQHMVAQKLPNIDQLMSPYQKALLQLYSRANQKTCISPETIAAAVRCDETGEFIFEFGCSHTFNPIAVLEPGPCIIGQTMYPNWKELLVASIDDVINQEQSVMTIVTRVFQCWHSDFMMQLTKCRGTSECPYPGILMRHPIWSIRSIVHYLYYDRGLNNRFIDLMNYQLDLAIINKTRKEMLQSDHVVKAGDLGVMRLAGRLQSGRKAIL